MPCGRAEEGDTKVRIYKVVKASICSFSFVHTTAWLQKQGQASRAEHRSCSPLSSAFFQNQIPPQYSS